MRRFILQSASFIYAQIDARDVVLAIGLLLLSAGLYQVSVPASLIVPGIVLTYIAVFGGPKASE